MAICKILAGVLLLAFIAEATAKEACVECPSDWLTFGDYCYFETNGGTYDSNAAECKALGARVAVPHSKEEDEFLLSIRNSKAVWINCNDRDHEGEFVCCDGFVSDYRNWRDGEPNNAQQALGDEDCVTTFNTHVWNDINCDVEVDRPAVCKKHVTAFV